MLLSFSFFIITLFIFLTQIEGKKCKFLLLTFLFYIIIIFLEQFYLENFHGKYFNYSDPSGYYDATKNLDFYSLTKFLFGQEYGGGKSNIFYFFLNWLYQSGFYSPTIYGIFIKITNAIFYLFAYMIVTKDREKIGLFDIILLFHPWLLMVVIRNVRDLYIIFTLSFFLYFIKKERLRVSDLFFILLLVLFVYTLRPFLLVLMVISILLRFYQPLSLRKKVFTASLVILIVSLAMPFFWYDLNAKVRSHVVGGAIFFERTNEEEIKDVMPDIADTSLVSSDFISFALSKGIIALPVFILTPHPYNFFTNYLQLRDKNGTYGIYTDVDVILIILGSIVNYIIVLPILIKYLFSLQIINAKYVLIPLFILLVYSFVLMGNPDMRIRFTFFFFLLVGFYSSNLTMLRNKSDVKYVVISLMLCLIIPFISSQNL